MDGDTLTRVFEPFYSTKMSDEGSGLGLAMVYGIVKQSNGVIEAISEPGAGTTFRIYLPRVLGEHVQMEPQAPASTSTGKGECILVVEDEKSLRDMTQRFLESEGYSVLLAESAEEAAGIVDDENNRIDLLLTDIVLPGMDGVTLATKLIEEGFSGQILYMTGYTREDILPGNMKKSDRQLLEKPFSLSTLSHRIREILDSG